MSKKKNCDIVINAKKVNVYYSKCDSDVLSTDVEICDDENTEIEENDGEDTLEPRIPVSEVYHVYRRDVKNEAFTEENTKVVSTDSKVFNAHYHYAVLSVHDGTILNKVDFQEGPIKEVGLNGVFHEDLLLMIIDRLESFQDSDFKCKENDVALKHLYSAVKALRQRTDKRKKDGIEGTSKVEKDAATEEDEDSSDNNKKRFPSAYERHMAFLRGDDMND